MPTLKASLLASSIASLFVMVGCSSAPDDTTTSGDNAFTAAPAANPDVPRYTDAEAAALPAYEGRARISVNGAALEEDAEVTGARTACATEPLPYETLIGTSQSGNYELSFGRTGVFPITVGTYSCADGDAAIRNVVWNKQDVLTTNVAATACTIVVDEVMPSVKGPDDDLVLGRFSADAGAGGLNVPVRGAFVISLAHASPGTTLCGK